MMLREGGNSRLLRRALPGLAASKGAAHGMLWAMQSTAMAIVLAAALWLGSLPASARSVNDSSSAGAALASSSERQASLERKQLTKVLSPPKIGNNEPMLLQADEMIYDNDHNKVTARGNVEIYYGNYTLLAEQVVYDRNANTLNAEGNVRIKDPSGAVITADHMTLTDDFRDGFIDALKLVTQDDTRIVAESANREAGNVTVFHNGWFTPCKPCEEHPERPPTWRIRAKTIIHKKDEATITYKNAFFDFFGVPIVWVPYFQTADPTVKRKSGFLIPHQETSDQLGTAVTIPYYFALSDTYDFTFAPMITEKEGTLLEGIWRQRFSNGGYSVDAAGVFHNDDDLAGPDESFRGSIKTQGKFALDPYWSWGWDILEQTDDTFRRFYQLDSVLRTDEVSQIYLEGIHDRNYMSLRAYDVRSLVYDDPTSKARVPILDYDYIVNKPILGGELSFNTNAMDLTRDDGDDSARFIQEVNWRRQMIDGIGEVYTPFAQLRGDVYDVDNYINPTTDHEADGVHVRGDAVAGIQYSYPFIARTGNVSHIIEPIAQITTRPNSVGDQNDIPDEDANSLVFDDTLLFDINKFSGYDRLETGTRADVGVRYTAQFYSGAYARAVFGQSYQLAGENAYKLYPDSGLDTDKSDYVTGLYLQAATNLAFSAQTRFDESTWELRRTDLGSSTTFGPIQIVLNYANVTAQPGIALDEPREEILTQGGLALTQDWSFIGNIRYDLESDQPIAQGLGVQFKNDCFTLGVTFEQTFVEDLDIQPDKRFMVNFALKDLGAYNLSTDADFGPFASSSE